VLGSARTRSVGSPTRWSRRWPSGATVRSIGLFAGNTRLSSTSSITGFTVQQVASPTWTPVTDAVEVTATGGTSLRYDAAAGQFIQNWATPKTPGKYYVVTMTTSDGSTLSANFLLK